MQVRLVRQQPRDCRLAGAWRTPEDERSKRFRGNQPAEDAVRPDQMVLPDHFREPRRTHSIRKRTRSLAIEAGRGEEIAHEGGSNRAYTSASWRCMNRSGLVSAVKPWRA